MPAEGIHLTALREALTLSTLPVGARRCALQHEDAARMGAVMLDLPYFDHYEEEVVRYLLRRAPRSSPFGAVVHDQAAVTLALGVLARARAARSDALAAMALGLFSHCALDRQLHPLINALARKHAGPLTHGQSHREVEKFQSICFHQAYLGRDFMGTPAVARWCAVPMRELLARDDVGPAVAAAFAEGMQPAPDARTLRRMARGYEHHAALLGTFLGARVADEDDKAQARPRFLHGAWGQFDGLLGQAITGSIEVLERAWACFTATDADAAAAWSALRGALPEGSIDPLGERVDLDQPYVIAPLGG
jgi:hypothetical protein